MTTQLDWDAILDDQAANSDDYSALPAGPYTVQVDDATAKVAQSGNAMISVTCRVLGGPYDGRIVWTNIVFATSNATAMKFTLRKLKALGVTRDWIADNNPTTEQIATKIIDKVVDVDIEIRQWDGEDRNEIKTFRKSTATPSPASASKSAKPKKAKASARPDVPQVPAPSVDKAESVTDEDAEDAEDEDEPF